MAIEQVSRISTQPVDSSGFRNGGSRLASAPAPGVAAADGAAATPYAGAPGAAVSSLLSISYDGLSLPLPAGATLAKPSAQRNGVAAAVAAAYSLSRAAATPQLVGARLPPEAIARIAREALLEAAAEAGKSLERFLEEAPIRKSELLPSQNADDARFTARTAVLAEDDSGQQALDIYVSRTGARAYEVAVFHRADAAPGGAFPYLAPPLSLDRLTVDPFSGQILAVMAAQLAATPQRFAQRQPTPAAVGGFLVGVMIALTAIVGVVMLATGESPLLALALLIGSATMYFKLSPGSSA